jgi:hypothetical protein
VRIEFVSVVLMNSYRKYAKRYSRIVDCGLQSAEWQKCVHRLTKFVEDFPDDVAARNFLVRAKEYQSNEHKFTGATILEQK